MLTSYRKHRIIAIAEALCVTVILGLTLVLVKLVLSDLGPFTITASRYSLAFVMLMPFLLFRGGLGHYSYPLWMRFILLAVSFYVVGNVALYLGLKFIPATTGSLLLNFVPLLVVLAGIVFLREIPTLMQVAGLTVVLVGSAVFFSSGLRSGEPVGIAIVSIGLIGIAVFSLTGREIQRKQLTDTLTLTAIPIGIGSIILLPLALLVEGIPHAPLPTWAIIFVLAGLNTAGVYALMNHALKYLEAFEMAVIVDLTPLLTALWAWLILNEKLRMVQILGIIGVISGIIMVERGKHTREVY